MSVKAPAICTRIYGRSSAARDATPKSSPRRCSAISTKRKSSLPKPRAALEKLAPPRRPRRPQHPKRRRNPSASPPRASPTPVPRAHRTRTPRRRTRALARPPHPQRARVVVVTSSLPWSSLSPGSLSLRRPNSSASRTPPDSTQSPVAFRTTDSCARAAPNHTQPPGVETIGIVAVAGLGNADLWQARERRGKNLSGRAGGGCHSTVALHAGSTRAEFGRRGRGEMPFAAAYRRLSYGGYATGFVAEP